MYNRVQRFHYISDVSLIPYVPDKRAARFLTLEKLHNFRVAKISRLTVAQSKGTSSILKVLNICTMYILDGLLALQVPYYSYQRLKSYIYIFYIYFEKK